jgi:hypothetical protein
MKMQIIDTKQIRDIGPEVLDKKGQLFIMPASYYRNTTAPERALLGHRRALYGLPTLELVQWIKDYIGGRRAIEIGAAHGLLAKALGIRATDNYLQGSPEIKAAYESMG